MPVKEHYSGHGIEIMRKMIKKYGKERGKNIFYATEMKRKKRKKHG